MGRLARSREWSGDGERKSEQEEKDAVISPRGGRAGATEMGGGHVVSHARGGGGG